MEQESPRVTVDDVYEAIRSGKMIENYPKAVRGSCCLISGETGRHRPIHIVCTSTRTPLFIITAYEPKPPKFVSRAERNPER